MEFIALSLKPLTADAFAPYGDVIEACNKNQVININYGRAKRHHDLARIDVGDEQGKPLISIFESCATKLPFLVRVMECHPLGSQAFFPIDNIFYIVLVCKPGDFDYQKIEGFLAKPGQGVNYHKGTWHHHNLALDTAGKFLVVDRGGNGDNLREAHIPNDVVMQIIL